MSDKKIEELIAQHQVNFLRNLEMVLSGFIHDLNNPVAVIAGQSSIMKTLVEMEKDTPEKTLKSSTKILSSCDKMAVIIQTLRDFYKPSALDDSKANLKLAYDTTYHLSTVKISRKELLVNSSAFENELFITGNPLTLNLLLWNIHYLFLDTLELNNENELSISCEASTSLGSISYKLTNSELPSDYESSTEILVAKKYCDELGGELELSPNQMTINLKLTD
jgi:C4-dicarboxylate-specific signal transduction histidine kinase